MCPASCIQNISGWHFDFTFESGNHMLTIWYHSPLYVFQQLFNLCTYIGEDLPSLRDLYIHALKEAADRWRDIGVLLLNPATLRIIEKNNPQDVEKCCKCMLEKWLDTQPDACWNQLLEVLRSPGVELNTLAHQIELKLRRKCKTIFLWCERQKQSLLLFCAK